MAPDTPTQAAVKINGTTLSPRSAEIIKYIVQNARETTAETVSWATDGVSLGKNFVPASKSTAETEHDRAEAPQNTAYAIFHSRFRTISMNLFPKVYPATVKKKRKKTNTTPTLNTIPKNSLRFPLIFPNRDFA